MELLTKKCLLCGDNESLTDLYEKNFTEKDLTPQVFSARRTTEHFHYKIVRCHCGLVFSKEILSDASLLPLYTDSQLTFDDSIPIIRKDYWRHLAPFLENRKKGRALEIGCSSGFFLEELKAQGFEQVDGCEPSVEAKKKASPAVRDCIHQGFFVDGIYPDKSFDLICSFQTIDHLSDPAAILKVCRKALKPGGLVYFICHNVDALQAKILREKSPIIDVEHIYLFSKKTLRLFFEKSGFEVVSLGNIQNSYPLSYWLRMLPLPPGLKAFLSGMLKTMGLLNWSMPLSAGNMFIVAQARD